MSSKKISKRKSPYRLIDDIDKMRAGTGKNEVSFGIVCFRVLPRLGNNKVFCHVHHITPSLSCTNNKKTSKNLLIVSSMCPSLNESSFQVLFHKNNNVSPYM